MNSTVDMMVNAYAQIGFMALFCIVVLALIIWYFTKGRKDARADRDKLVKEQTRGNQLIENCTAVINNNSKVIELNTRTRLDEKESLDRLGERIENHGKQLDTLLTNQTVCMDRQNRK